ncbi:MAG TPA: ankyrin repeat domain-containing protein [Bryobacteraceae bacterium]|jgi:ankyrin repeat protein|nr:ankyrin repeat domain-containing protein [Bryobacteraceae bacterium]
MTFCKNSTLRAAVCLVFSTSLISLSSAGAVNSAVADAAMKGDTATLRMLIQKNADVNAVQADGTTAIQWAAYRNDLEMADILIAARVDVKLANRDGATPLWLAAENGSARMIGKLLEAGADPNERTLNGETPLMMASRNGNVAALELLLDHKADPALKEKLRGTTALMWAVEQSHPEAIRTLIAHGADVNAASNSDTRNSRLNLAPTVQERIVQDKLIDAFANGKKVQLTPGGPAVSLEDLADSYGQSGKKDGGGLTPLVYAARESCFQCAQLLVQAGAKVNQTTTYGWTALLTATQNRHYKLAAYLLDRGADPNLANNGGWTPLYLATDNRNIESGDYPVRKPDMDHLDFIKLLLAKGARVNTRICGVESSAKECKGDTTETRTNFTMQWLSEEGATPFLRAAQSGDVTLMKLLLDRGADPRVATSHGVTALEVASGIGWVEGITFEWSPEQSLEAVRMCLNLGIDVNSADDEGRTALHGAAHKGRTDVIRLLVDHGANLEAHDKGSRDTFAGAMKGMTWIPLDWSRGLVRVGVQSAVAHPEAEKLLIALMKERGMNIPPPPGSSICLTKGVRGCQ